MNIGTSVSAAVLLSFIIQVIFPCLLSAAAGTETQGKQLTLLYSNNVLGELVPCG